MDKLKHKELNPAPECKKASPTTLFLGESWEGMKS